MKICICGHIKTRHIVEYTFGDNMNPCLDCDCLDFERTNIWRVEFNEF